MLKRNALYYGDNLEVLRRYVADESVDLIYLDPPFKSNQDYNVLFEERNGTASAAQIKAFEDTWRWDEAAARAYEEIVEAEAGGKVSRALEAFRSYLGENDMMAYLAMMAPRLVELRRILKSTGSIYLHCDPTASHYLKMLMDAVFGVEGFRNEIVWCYRKWSVTARQFARNHDVILFYSKAFNGRHLFIPQHIPVSPGTMRRWKGKKQQAYFEKGVRKATSIETTTAQTPMPDWWDISIINPNAAERLGYPTQKPEALLERIIEASSNEGDVVLDPFCGCGTTVAVAQKLKRKWIGIDITHLAVALIKHRLKDAYAIEEKRDYDVIGEPTDLAGAKRLAKDNPFQFQCWAVGKVGAFPKDVKKGADKGIDGRIKFHDEHRTGKTKHIILSVKGGGNVGVRDVRDLRGVIERENVEIGVLITMAEPTQPMRTEAASAGFYKSPWGSHPRIQILTIQELLGGKRINYPVPEYTNRTFKKARRVRNDRVRERALGYAGEE